MYQKTKGGCYIIPMEIPNTKIPGVANDLLIPRV